MTVDISQFHQVFFEETAEHLDEMEHLLLGLDIDSPSPDDLNAIFRAAHSIKGGSGTFGFTDMTGVTHILETLLDRLRKNEIVLRREMVDAFLEAGDVLRGQLAGHQHGAPVDARAVDDVCATLHSLARDDATAAATTASPSAAQPRDAVLPDAVLRCYRIEFSPDSRTLAQITDFGPLFAELAGLGSLEVTERPGEQAPEGDGPPRRSWLLVLQSAADEASISDIFAFFVQPEQVKIESLPPDQLEDQGAGLFAAAETVGASDAGYGFFADGAESAATPATPEADDTCGYGFFSEIPGAQETAVAVKAPEPPLLAVAGKAADDSGQGERRSPERRRGADRGAAGAPAESSSIRVSIDKVDQLINLVGELVITQSMLAQTATEVDALLHEKLMHGMAQLDRNTRDLQESVMSIRMMPISFVFSRFPRVVRDLAAKLEKKVELVTLGEGTELDKGLIEKITDPLTHLIRNCLDHGIESPGKRLAAGKVEHGTITLQAAHQGGNILISVADDGAGLQRERILAKAKEKGLPVSDTMTDSEVWQLIFAPGFSTAEVVTDVSGRGVGMDVVKKNISSLNGEVEIESSPGWGSRVTIRLPLTLAILDGMSISAGGQIFIIPLTFIIESLQPDIGAIKTIAGKGRVLHVRGEYLPLVALHEVFNFQPRVTEFHRGIVVLLVSEGRKIALFVDDLVGQHQVVIKSLETNFRKVPGVSGATIMGDGSVALILDVSALGRVRQQHLQEENTCS